MNILIANVGNIRVNEIKVLAEALNKKHRVTIACMMTESSNKGLAFSFRDKPIRVTPLVYKDIIKSSAWIAQGDLKSVSNTSSQKLAAFDDIAAYEFGGTPADAVAVTLAETMAHRKPDLVICGINNGNHMGQDIYCSSNIGMAFESAFLGFKTIAVAIERKIGGHTDVELENVATFIEKNVENFVALDLPSNTILNINVPTVTKYKNFRGVHAARMGRMTQLNEYVEKTDSNGEKYYWANHVERRNADQGEQYARTWFEQGYITITPISYDSTDYEAIRTWDIKKDFTNAVAAEEAQA